MTSRPDAQPRGLMTRRASLVFQIATLGTVTASSGAPTPIYPIYQDHLGLTSFQVTMIFAVYAFSLLLALLTVGALSDYVGRKPVMFAAVALDLVAMVLFIVPSSLASLIAARFFQGIAIGIAMSTIGAAVLDSHRAHGSLVNSLTPLTGTAIGALVAALMVTYAPMPTQLLFIILLALMTVQAVLVWWMPETAAPRPGALASLLPTVIVPVHVRRSLLLVTPGSVATWALGGFYLALMPSLLRAVTHATSPLPGGIVVAVMTFSGSFAIVVARTWPATTILIRSLACLMIGTAITLAGVSAQSVVLLMIGAVIGGFGFGSNFFGTIRTVMPLAQPYERAGLLSVIFIVCYVAFSIPTLVAGLAVPMLGLARVLDIYGAVVLVLSAISLVALLISNRQPTSMS